MNINQQTVVRRLPFERSIPGSGGGGKGGEAVAVGTEGARVDRVRVVSTRVGGYIFMTLTSLRRTFNSANRLSWVRVTRSANTSPN